jgi:hypothetical protein
MNEFCLISIIKLWDVKFVMMELTITWLCSKIRLVAFAINNIFGRNNLCHSSCDFYDYVVQKDKILITIIKKYN